MFISWRHRTDPWSGCTLTGRIQDPGPLLPGRIHFLQTDPGFRSVYLTKRTQEPVLFFTRQIQNRDTFSLQNVSRNRIFLKKRIPDPFLRRIPDPDENEINPRNWWIPTCWSLKDLLVERPAMEGFNVLLLKLRFSEWFWCYGEVKGLRNGARTFLHLAVVISV